MIVVGFVMAILGYWLLPDFLPTVPAQVDTLVGGVGVIFIFIGIVLLVLCLAGRPVGGRQYWY